MKKITFILIFLVCAIGFSQQRFNPQGGDMNMAACEETSPTNGFEDGYPVNAGSTWFVANDVNVADGENFTLNQATFTFAHEPGTTIEEVSVLYYEDLPDGIGAQIGEELSIIPTSQTVIGNPFGLDLSEVVIDVTPFMFSGQEGATTRYWIGTKAESSSGGSVYFETTFAGMVGLGVCVNQSGNWTSPYEVTDGSYTWTGDCTPIGGGEPTCGEESPSIGFEDGYPINAASSFFAANDVNVAADEDFTLNQITLTLAHTAGTTIDEVSVLYYEDLPDGVGTQIGEQLSITPTSQTVIGNPFGFDLSEVVIDVTPFMFSGQEGVATRYWIGTKAESSNGGEVYLELVWDAVGLGVCINQSGPWTDPFSQDGAYTWTGDCTPIGGGNECTVSEDFDAGLPAGWSTVVNTGTCDWSNGATMPSGPSFDTPAMYFDDDACGSGADPSNVTLMSDIYNTTGATTATLSFDAAFWQVGSGETFLVEVYDGTNWQEVAFYFQNVDPIVTENLDVTFYAQNANADFQVRWTYDDAGDWGWHAGVDNFCLTHDGGGSTGPENDLCADAIAISCGDAITGDTTGATNTDAEPSCVTALDQGPGLWYNLTIPNDGDYDVTIDTFGSAFDTKLGVFSGDCGALVCVTGNDDTGGLQSEVMFVGAAGESFYVYITGYSTNAGEFNLNVACDAIGGECTVSEDFNAGLPAGWSTVVNTGDCDWENGNMPSGEQFPTNAMVYNDDACGDGSGASNVTLISDVYNANGATSVMLGYDAAFQEDNAGETFAVEVYDGAAWQQVALYDSSMPIVSESLDLTAYANANFQVRWTYDDNGAWGWGAGVDNFCLTHDGGGSTGPANDICTDAIAVSCGETVTGDTSEATDTAENGAPDLWYSFTGTGEAEMVTISLCDGGTDYDSMIGVYDACFGTLIAQNDDFCGTQSELEFESDGTTEYIILVEGWGTSEGNFSLAVTCAPILGTNDNIIEGLSYYPNPTSDVINLNAQDNIEKVILFNILGQKVIDQNINAISTQINVADLSTGTYIMNVTVDGKTGTYKVVKE